MTTDDAIAFISAIADAVGGEVDEQYSGRHMYGATCFGITCDNYVDTIEKAGALGLFGAKIDQLGKGYIVYWTHIKKS